MSKRKDAARQIGLELEKRHAALACAKGEKEVAYAAIHLGAFFNEHIDQIISYLKEFGGISMAGLSAR